MREGAGEGEREREKMNPMSKRDETKYKTPVRR
jgi:hypothetical protein